MNTPVKRGRGRPTKYDPAMCDRVIEYGRQGLSRTAIACELGISSALIPEWEMAHPDFLRAMNEAHDLARKHYEKLAESHMVEVPGGPRVNTQLFKFIVQARFPEYRENTRVEVSGRNGDAIEVDVIHDFAKDLMQDLLAARQADAESSDE